MSFEPSLCPSFRLKAVINNNTMWYVVWKKILNMLVKMYEIFYYKTSNVETLGLLKMHKSVNCTQKYG